MRWSTAIAAVVVVAAAASAAPTVKLGLRMERGYPFRNPMPPAPPCNGTVPTLFTMATIDGLALGTPPQPWRPMADTGSAQAVPFLSTCASDVCRAVPGPFFNPAASSTAYAPYRDFGFGYGGFDVIGEPLLDTLHVTPVDAPGTALHIRNFTFFGGASVNASSKVPPAFDAALVPSGIAGMGWIYRAGEARKRCPAAAPPPSAASSTSSSLDASAAGKPPLPDRNCFGQLLPQLFKSLGPSTAQVMGLQFGKWDENTGTAAPGVLEVGGFDPALFHGPLAWLNASTPEIPLQITNAMIDGVPAPAPCALSNYGCAADIDSGAGLMFFDMGVQWTIGRDCKGFERLPTLSFTLLGTLNVSFAPTDYVFRTRVGNDSATGAAQWKCESGLQQVYTVPGGDYTRTTYSPPDTPVYILGGRFFEKVYSVQTLTEYDVAQKDGPNLGWAVPPPRA